MQETLETWVRSLDWELSLEERMAATQFSVLAWRIPWTEERGGLQSIGSQRVRNNWCDLVQVQCLPHMEVISLFPFFYIPVLSPLRTLRVQKSVHTVACYYRETIFNWVEGKQGKICIYIDRTYIPSSKNSEFNFTRGDSFFSLYLALT